MERHGKGGGVNLDVYGGGQNRKGRLHWRWKEEAIAQEKLFDSCYIVSTDVTTEQMKEAEVVTTYKKLSLAEQAFRNLKTVALEIRPVYHKKDDRIRSHVFFVCWPTMFSGTWSSD
ncbi:MAG: hypothetical protein L0387_18245 [Acidobacteria bacterium]|nr:hypothetical protein [Acidobacteriota bacterium]